MKVSDISVQKRSARGVRIIRLDEDDRVVGLAVLQQEILSASLDDEAEELVVNDPDVEEQSHLDL
jgi:DNA gyrase subunit A